MKKSNVSARSIFGRPAEELLNVVQSRHVNKDDILELLLIAVGLPQPDWPAEKKWLHSCLLKSLDSRSLDEGFGLTKAKPSGTRVNILNQIHIQEFERQGWLKHHKSESKTDSVSYVDLAEQYGVSANTIAKIVANVLSSDEADLAYREMFADEIYEDQLKDEQYGAGLKDVD